MIRVEAKPETMSLLHTPLFHHAINFGYVGFREIYPPHRKFVRDQELTNTRLDEGYKWFFDKYGYFPIFMAVGRLEEIHEITGFPSNPIIFSFNSLPSGIFTDYDRWSDALFGRTEGFVEEVIKPDLSNDGWIEQALRVPASVQLLVPSLDLRDAASALTWNSTFAYRLTQMGFPNVRVKNF